MSTSLTTENDKRMSFYVVTVIREQGKPTIFVYRKPFSGIYAHFVSFYHPPTELV